MKLLNGIARCSINVLSTTASVCVRSYSGCFPCIRTQAVNGSETTVLLDRTTTATYTHYTQTRHLFLPCGELRIRQFVSRLFNEDKVERKFCIHNSTSHMNQLKLAFSTALSPLPSFHEDTVLTYINTHGICFDSSVQSKQILLPFRINFR